MLARARELFQQAIDMALEAQKPSPRLLSCAERMLQVCKA